MTKQRQDLSTKGLASAKISALQASQSAFLAGIENDVRRYSDAKKGKLPPSTLETIGQTLIGLRIASGMTQVELAAKLGITQAQVSQDEADEYHGISVERASKILERFGYEFQGRVIRRSGPMKKVA